MRSLGWNETDKKAKSNTAETAAADKEEELFDIVDDSNCVIGQERRSVVHARGLKHRAVYCFVFNTEGALLLQQRSLK